MGKRQDVTGISHMGPSNRVKHASGSFGGQPGSVWQRRPRRYHEIAGRVAVVASDIAVRAVLRTHSSCRRRASAGVRRSCRGWRRSELVDAAQDVGEQVARNGDLGHLERDVTAMADDLRANLDELLAQRRQ